MNIKHLQKAMLKKYVYEHYTETDPWRQLLVKILSKALRMDEKEIIFNIMWKSVGGKNPLACNTISVLRLTHTDDELKFFQP